MKRSILFAAALLAGAGLAEAKDTLTLGMTLEPPGLDPTTKPAAAIGEIVHYNVLEGLTKINEDFSITPLLAESWTFSPDLLTLTLKLKPGVKFQNGEPLTSQAVKASFERYGAKDSTNKDKPFFASIDAIDASDPAQVVLKFKAPSFSALTHLGYNTAVILDEKSAADTANHPIGTGPYKLASWNKGASLTLDAWDGYRDAAHISIKHVTFKFISDPAAEAAAVLSGDVDAFPRVTASSLDAFKADARLAVRVGGSEGKTIVALNNARPPFNQLKVRQAVAYALDRKAIIDGAVSGLGTPIGSHLTPNDPGYVDLTGLYPHDPAKAKALLGGPLTVTLTLPPPPYARQGGEIVAAQLAEVGITAKIENVEWAQWLANVYTNHNYDMTIINHVEPLDIGIYANPKYYYGYDSPTVQGIIAKLDTAPDVATYAQAFTDASKQIAADSVNAFLFQSANVVVADAKLKGLWRNAPIFANDIAAMSWK